MSKTLSKFAAAAIIYAGFAFYLYYPYFRHFKPLQYLFVINACFAALGCFVLSRRWVTEFFSSFFAGAIYGFGPFALGLAGYHPTVGFLVAAIPWLFCPAAFIASAKWRWTVAPLSTIPFLAMLLFFELFAHLHLFPIPTQEKLHLVDLAGLLTPLVMINRSLILVSFYHIPIASLVVGISMLLSTRRFGIITIFTIGLIFGFCDSFFNISPVIWMSIPVLCCSVLIGEGIQKLSWAGFADRKPILLTAIIMGALAVATLLLATKYFQTFAGLGTGYAKLFTEAAKLYILGTIAVAIIYFTARAKLRVHRLRLAVLCSAIAVDIFFGARFIIDRIF